MGAPEIATKNSQGKVICQVPDVCNTPCGPIMVPVPYQITASFEDSDNVSTSVTVCGDPVFLYDKSTITKVTGDMPGSGNGIKSGTVGDMVKPVASSKTVKVNGKLIVRNNDLCEMNNGNTIGKVVLQSGGPACGVDPDGKPTADTNPPRQKKKE